MNGLMTSTELFSPLGTRHSGLSLLLRRLLLSRLAGVSVRGLLVIGQGFDDSSLGLPLLLGGRWNGALLAIGRRGIRRLLIIGQRRNHVLLRLDLGLSGGRGIGGGLTHPSTARIRWLLVIRQGLHDGWSRFEDRLAIGALSRRLTFTHRGCRPFVR